MSQRIDRVGRLLDAALRAVRVVALVLLTATVAAGSAGIVAIWSHPAGTAARGELTFEGDARLSRDLDLAQATLVAISADVDRLSTLSRGAIGALTADDQEPFVAALGEGSTLATTIRTESSALQATLFALPGDDPADALYYSAEVLGRRSAMLTALDTTEGLGRSWATLTAGSLRASRLIQLLTDHDPTVAEAAASGRATDYDAAIATLATAGAMLDEAETIRDQLANASDVSTLDTWIARNRAYDDALTALYVALRDAGGRVTDAVREAYAAEGAARANLPPDTRGLVVIVADIGRGGLNQAVIAIEQARGRLTLALQALGA